VGLWGYGTKGGRHGGAATKGFLAGESHELCEWFRGGRGGLLLESLRQSQVVLENAETQSGGTGTKKNREWTRMRRDFGDGIAADIRAHSRFKKATQNGKALRLSTAEMRRSRGYYREGCFWWIEIDFLEVIWQHRRNQSGR
jgi:hypothetical protein